jgi:hypothetical protein
MTTKELWGEESVHPCWKGGVGDLFNALQRHRSEVKAAASGAERDEADRKLWLVLGYPEDR